MASLKGVTDKLPYGDTTIGMVAYALGAFQIVGMITGKWNIIPFMGRKIEGPLMSDTLETNRRSDYFYGHQVAKGVGGIRFGGSDIQADLADRQFTLGDAQRLARVYPGAPEPARYDSAGWKSKTSFIKSTIAKLRV